MKYAGGTFLGLKTMMCSNYITIVVFDCLYQKRKSNLDTMRKILKWRACKDITDVRVFFKDSYIVLELYP